MPAPASAATSNPDLPYCKQMKLLCSVPQTDKVLAAYCKENQGDNFIETCLDGIAANTARDKAIDAYANASNESRAESNCDRFYDDGDPEGSAAYVEQCKKAVQRTNAFHANE